MNSKTYKYCIVPKCTNTTIKAPQKLFFVVPKIAKIRKQWCKLMKRNPHLSEKTSLYCCEDHFNLEEDMQNYWEYKLMGNVRVKLKMHAVPHIFHCQRKSAAMQVDRRSKAASKRMRKSMVKEALGESSTATIQDDVDESVPNIRPYHRRQHSNTFPPDLNQPSVSMKTMTLNKKLDTLTPGGHQHQDLAHVKQETPDEKDTAACPVPFGDDAEIKILVSDELIMNIKQEVDREACSTSELDCNIRTEQCTVDVKEEIDQQKAAVDCPSASFSEATASLEMYDIKQKADELFSTQSEGTFLNQNEQDTSKIDTNSHSLWERKSEPDQNLTVSTESEIKCTQESQRRRTINVYTSNPFPIYSCTKCNYQAICKENFIVHIKGHYKKTHAYKCAQRTTLWHISKNTIQKQIVINVLNVSL